MIAVGKEAVPIFRTVGQLTYEINQKQRSFLEQNLADLPRSLQSS